LSVTLDDGYIPVVRGHDLSSPVPIAVTERDAEAQGVDAKIANLWLQQV